MSHVNAAGNLYCIYYTIVHTHLADVSADSTLSEMFCSDEMKIILGLT